MGSVKLKMQVTVTTLRGDVFSLEVPEDLELENFKAFCEAESGVPSKEMVIMFNGAVLKEDKKPLKEHGVKNGDMVVMEKVRKQASNPMGANPLPGGGLQLPDFSKIRIPGAGAQAGPSTSKSKEEDPAWIREMLKSNPDQLALLKQNNPRLAEALEASPEEFAKILREQQKARLERENARLRLLTADPMDLEAQRLIAQEIENKNIEQNMEMAMEYSPESFGTVVMLYIDCMVNGHPIKAFVDSGAQATIMSQAAAERCNIMRLVDRRWAGIAKGVGTQKIIGRVHMAQIQIKDDFLTSSFSILEEQPMDMLLGLDMLKRHQCSIDLKRNLLVIGSTGTETPFLAESELPECARLSNRQMEGKSASELEDQQLAEALAKSQAEMGKKEELKNKDILSSDKFSEGDVQTLMAYGFPRDKCIEELRAQNGDVTQATAALFAKSIKVNK